MHEVLAFRGAGLRPLSPCHLRAGRGGAGWDLSWVRRTRIDGDSWDGYEVPLGEASELYLVRVIEGTTVRREATVSTPAWSYSLAQAVADGITGPFAIEVMQISDVFGPGLSARIVLAP